MTGEQTLQALREALRLSPENLPLRRHLAESLLSFGRPEEAEAEFRSALNLAPEDVGLKVGLANAFARQDKTTHALVILEDAVKHPDAPALAFVSLARLLARGGELDEAAACYRKGVERDRSVADEELASRLGVAEPAPEPEPETEAPDWTGSFDDSSSEIVAGRMREAWMDGSGEHELELERPALRFADVGGMEPLKDEIRLKIIHPLAHPELYKAYGKPVGGGILLYGPPGCGKTYLARATAGEIQSSFLAVGINDILEMWVGNSEKNLHGVFEQARANRPCVLFFDEVDALAANRADLRGSSGGRQLINQFLSETDGIHGRNDGVLILAATNAPWHLDPAFRRPGRFDRILFVPPPDRAARAQILKLMCRDKPALDIDFEQVAKKTEQFSGADLKAVVDVAVESKLREALKAGVPKPLSTKDLLAAAASLKPTTREWFATARNYALYSNQGGMYDDVIKFMKL